MIPGINRFVGWSVFLLCMATATSRADAPMGVTSQPGSTTYRVWAPNAQSVAVIGEFNNWRAAAGDQLSREGDSGIWSLTQNRSRPRGAYQFLINGQLYRRDPYARAVTPDGKRSLFYDPAAFSWTDDRAPFYALEDLIIYEMHIGAFHDPKPADGLPATFADAARRLDYLVELGVNTLCLLPVHEFNGKHSWGYNPSDLFAVEQAYGGPDGLKQFVKMCHARGLAVHLDLVHNHYGPQNLDLLQFDGTGGLKSGGIYFYEGEGIGLTPWGPRPRFEQTLVRRFIRDNVFMWLEEYRVDGFRWDSTINIRAYNFGANALPAGARMLETINNEITSRFPGKWSIAEDSLNIGNFHGSWDYDFHHQVMPALSAKNDRDRDMYRVAEALGRVGAMSRVVYVDNHDEAGKMNHAFRIATDIAPQDPGGDLARRLSGLGAALTFTAPGIPLLFMGNEFQEYGTFHDDIPLDWNKTTKHAGTLALHRDLIALRRNRTGNTFGLKGRAIQVPVIDNTKKLLVYWRGHERSPDDQVVVAINFSGVATEVVAPFPSAGAWIMRLNTDDERYGGATKTEPARPFTLDASAKAKVPLAPYSARIFSLVERPTPGTKKSVPVSAASATGKPAAPKPPFSMYAGIHVIGNFNEGNLTNRPLRLISDYQWEGVVELRGVRDPTFTLSANADGKIYWGSEPGGADVTESAEKSVKRLGKPFMGRGLWDGLYRFSFNEDVLSLAIERVGDGIEEKAASVDRDDFRTWTDTRGATQTGRLLEVNEMMVTLLRQDGQRLQVPLSRFIEADREFVREWQRATEDE